MGKASIALSVIGIVIGVICIIIGVIAYVTGFAIAASQVSDRLSDSLSWPNITAILESILGFTSVGCVSSIAAQKLSVLCALWVVVLTRVSQIITDARMYFSTLWLCLFVLFCSVSICRFSNFVWPCLSVCLSVCLSICLLLVILCNCVLYLCIC